MQIRNSVAQHPASRQNNSKRYRSSSLLIFVFWLSTLVSPVQALANDNNSTVNTGANTDTQEALDIEYPDWFKTSFMELEEDILEARESGKRLMLVFHQPGCPYCNAFVERNLSQKDIEESVKSNFDVIEINMWGDLEVIDVGGNQFTEKTFARHLKVQFTPTVLMYDQNGAIALRINGYFPPDKFRAALKFVIEEDSSKQTFNEYLASLNAGIDQQNNQPPKKFTYIDTDDFSTDQSVSLPGGDSGKPYILLFEQKDCNNCQQLHDSVLADKDISALLDRFDVIRLDMWGMDQINLREGKQTSGRSLAKKLGINYAPTMVFYSTDHEEVIRSESWLKRFHTKSMLDYVLSDAWREQASFQNYIRDRAEIIRQNGGSVNILE